eukprot:TRINITY_DN17287_c0_g1_i1.p2 TRINITY_DN17287_c0_g1~~TRINITY_DN17287_c0_g1_i1.p2  ORF type:complete len:103 (+),score=1.37 TRINITY_DN17287_c0_g1_i1:296-604(+)
MKLAMKEQKKFGLVIQENNTLTILQLCIFSAQYQLQKLIDYNWIKDEGAKDVRPVLWKNYTKTTPDLSIASANANFCCLQATMELEMKEQKILDLYYRRVTY